MSKESNACGKQSGLIEAVWSLIFYLQLNANTFSELPFEEVTNHKHWRNNIEVVCTQIVCLHKPLTDGEIKDRNLRSSIVKFKVDFSKLSTVKSAFDSAQCKRIIKNNH